MMARVTTDLRPVPTFSVEIGPDGKDILLGTAAGGIICIGLYRTARPPTPCKRVKMFQKAPGMRLNSGLNYP